MKLRPALFSVFLLAFSGVHAEEKVEAVTWNEKAMIAFEQDGRHDHALVCLRRGIEAGEPESMVNYAFLLATGKEGLAKDEKKAFELLQKAADKGNPVAMLNLGFAYYYGRGVAKDEAEGIRRFEAAAKAGDPTAHYTLGLIAEKKKDLDTAVKHYEAAGEQHPQALNRLGLITWCKAEDAAAEEKAVRCFTKAGFRNYAPAENNTAYALTHFRYSQKQQNWKFAEAWYRKAAEHGYAPAEFNLANLYFGEAGSDFYKPEEAVGLLRSAASKGHAGAQYLLGTAYRNGTGIEKDLKKAVELYQRSAEQGYPYACLQLAVMYENGEGVEKSASTAKEWRRKSGLIKEAVPGDLQSKPVEKIPVK